MLYQILQSFRSTTGGAFVSIHFSCVFSCGNLLRMISSATGHTGKSVVCSCVSCSITHSKVFSASVTEYMPFIYRFLPRLCYPVVIPGCRDTLRVAASAGAGVCPYSRIAAGRLRGHSANIAVGMGRLARCARRTGAAGAGLAGGTTVRRFAAGRAAGAGRLVYISRTGVGAGGLAGACASLGAGGLTGRAAAGTSGLIARCVLRGTFRSLIRCFLIGRLIRLGNSFCIICCRVGIRIRTSLLGRRIFCDIAVFVCSAQCILSETSADKVSSVSASFSFSAVIFPDGWLSITLPAIRTPPPARHRHSRMAATGMAIFLWVLTQSAPSPAFSLIVSVTVCAFSLICESSSVSFSLNSFIIFLLSDSSILMFFFFSRESLFVLMGCSHTLSHSTSHQSEGLTQV